MNKSPYDIGCSGDYFHDFFFIFFIPILFMNCNLWSIYLLQIFVDFQDQEVDEELELLVLASDGLWDVVPNEVDFSPSLSLSLSLTHTHTPACAPPYSPSSHSSQLIRRKELCQFYGWYIELIYGLNISLKGWGYMYH